jgi:hypothetical protein
MLTSSQMSVQSRRSRSNEGNSLCHMWCSYWIQTVVGKGLSTRLLLCKGCFGCNSVGPEV